MGRVARFPPAASGLAAELALTPFEDVGMRGDDFAPRKKGYVRCLLGRAASAGEARKQ